VGPDGDAVYSDRRLFMQLLAYGNCRDTGEISSTLDASAVQGALYADLHDPTGVALVAASEDPDFFAVELRALLQGPAFSGLVPKPAYTMMGRTYSIGYETDLDHVLVHRPLQRLTNPDWPWAVWYPLRRCGAFSQLSQEEQRGILMEHGVIGNAFGRADYAHDIRLACHGLDANDNDFLVALVGQNLHPLSAVVQTMRATKQTSSYIEKMGPFFVGKAIWQRAL
jgi:chlorite dismutase